MCASSMSVFNFRKSFGIFEGQISVALRYLNKYHCVFCQMRFWFVFILTFRWLTCGLFALTLSYTAWAQFCNTWAMVHSLESRALLHETIINLWLCCLLFCFLAWNCTCLCHLTHGLAKMLRFSEAVYSKLNTVSAWLIHSCSAPLPL